MDGLFLVKEAECFLQFYTPIIITQLGNNYGLIAVGSLISYFIQTMIDAVSAWTYNNESKKIYEVMKS